MRSSRSEQDLYTGTLIKDLYATVEKVEQSAATKSSDGSHGAVAGVRTGGVNGRANTDPVRGLKSEKLPQSLGLSAADWNLALLLIVHAQLVRTLEPGYDFANAVDVHQVRAVSPPEQSWVQARK
jgi:hypothetical protein